jgi:anti-anti-sigma factor
MEESDDLLVIRLEAEQWDLHTSEELARLLAPAHRHPNVIVDMSNVTYMDSTCLSRLIAMRRERGTLGPVRLVVSSEQIRHLLRIVRFDHLWPTFGSLEQAMADAQRVR